MPHPAPARTLRLVLEYDGTDFSGWQIQRGKRTVQAEMGKAVQRVTGERVAVHASGRTDAGVHAEGQVAHVVTRTRLSCRRLLHALNANLPDDISVTSVEDASPGFHAQFDATGKTYRYRILNRAAPSALRRRRTYLIRQPLDVDRMREAASLLVGEHDFRSFCTEAAGRTSTVRRIHRLDVRREGDEVVVEVDGSGFLYNMVRSIVGTLLGVGLKRWTPADVGAILAARDRRQAGINIPPQGLCLVEVRYAGKSQIPNPKSQQNPKSEIPSGVRSAPPPGIREKNGFGD
jgi:tRNA pseudouridine38-40 synthase